MTEVNISSPLRRVVRLQRHALLVQKDSRLHIHDLGTDRPGKIVHDFSGQAVYGSELAVTPMGECLLTNGAALLACDIHGHCREMLRLETIGDPACDRHISGPFRFCHETQRMYFCLAPGRPGELPPEGAHGVYLCERDLNTSAVSFIRLSYLGEGCAVDGVSRVVYLPGAGRTHRDMVRSRDRVLKKSLAGERDETLLVPDCVNHCELTPDREQLLCSHDSRNCLVHLVDCRHRSFLGIKRRRCKRLPFTGFNASLGPRNTIFFAREGFSLWRYEAGSKGPEQLIEVKAQRALVSRIPLREGVEAVWEGTKPPLIDGSMGLLCWQVSLGISVGVAVIVDLLHEEYMVVDGSRRQMAFVSPAVCVGTPGK
jgi:hypothetical protein